MTVEENERDVEVEQSRSAVRKAPDGGYGWVVLIASFFVSFIIDGVMYSFGIILAEIREDKTIGAESSVCNLLSSLNTGFLFCSGPIVAGLASQFGCRVVVMGGGIITAIMYIVTALTKSIGVMLVSYGVIGGISTGCTYIASLIIIAEYFDKKKGVATGICMAGSGVGSFVFAPLLGYIIKESEWRFTMSICACIIVQTCIFGALLRPLPPIDDSPKPVELHNLKGKKQQANEPAGSGGHDIVQSYVGSMLSLNQKVPFYERNSCLRISVGILKEMTDFRLLCENWGFLLITLSNFFLFVGYFTPFLYITSVSETVIKDKEKASLLISVIGIVNIPARIIYGIIADRRIISSVNLNTFAVAVSTAPLFLFYWLKETYATQLVFAVLFAIGIAGMNSLTTMYLTDLVGMKRFSNATGIVNLFRGFGCFLGPFLGGIVAEKFGEAEAFFFSAILFSVGLLLTCLVSFGSMLQACRNGDAGDNTTEVNADPSRQNESDFNKNLLQNKA